MPDQAMTMSEVFRRVMATGETATFEMPMPCPRCERKLYAEVVLAEAKRSVDVKCRHERPLCEFAATGELVKWVAARCQDPTLSATVKHGVPQ